MRGKAFSAAQKGQLYQKGGFDNVGLEFFRQREGGSCRAAGCEEIIDQQDATVRRKCVLMNLYRVRSILKFVACRKGCGRKLAGFAHQSMTTAQGIGQGRAKEKPTRLYSQNDVYFVAIPFDELVLSPAARPAHW